MLHLLLITDIKKLKKEQTITSALAKNPQLTHSLSILYNELKNIESSILALYEKNIDPIWSNPYQRSLSDTFYNKQGKFTDWSLIEFKKRRSFDFFLFFAVFVAPLTVLGFFFKMKKEYYSMPKAVIINLFKDKGFNLKLIDDSFFGFIKEILTYKKALITFLFSAVYFGIAYAVLLLQGIQVYKTYRAFNDYISSRLVDIQTLFEIAQKINTILKNNPILEANCAHKFKHTRKLLTCMHENKAYNKLVERFLNYDFKNWSLWFNSTATLLTTFTLLDENINALKPILFEIGQIGTYLSVVDLIQNSKKYKNSFTYAQFLDQPHVYINLQSVWNTAISGEKAIPNDILIDGSKSNTVIIVGPNASGKSVITLSVIKSSLLGQTIAIVPAEKAEFTPIDSFFIFKEAKDDPSIQKSLFARELDYIIEHNAILKRSKKSNKKVLTLYDEFLTSTNPIEASALQVAIITHNMNTYPNNISIISTHNPYLIQAIIDSKKGRVMHVVIHRNPDGSYRPCYKIANGSTNEKVGVDLFEKEIKQAEIVRKARELVKKIEEKNREILLKDKSSS